MEDAGAARKHFPLAVNIMLVFNAGYAIYQALRDIILVMFLVDGLNLSLASSKILYHGTYVINGIMMPVASFLADGYLGNYNQAVLHVISFYALGYFLFFSSIPGWFFNSTFGAVLGIMTQFLCASFFNSIHFPLAADQLNLPTENKLLSNYFMFDYWIFNVGFTVGAFAAPVLRRDTGICPQRDCFPLCFGLSFVVLALSGTLILVFRKSFVKKKPYRANVVGKCINAMIYALKKKMSVKDKRDHWLDRADDKYDKLFLDDLKKLKSVYMLLPVPIFWAMYSQQETTWIFQARRMNGNLGFYIIPPDQMSVLNPIFCVILVPAFEYLIYPYAEKRNLLKTMLQKMCVGVMFFLFAYVLSGILVFVLEQTDIVLPGERETLLYLYNPNNCTLNIESEKFSFTVPHMDYNSAKVSLDDGEEEFLCNVTCGAINSATYIQAKEEQFTGAFLLKNGSLVSFKDALDKTEDANPIVRVISNTMTPVDINFEFVDNVATYSSSEYEKNMELSPGEYKVHTNKDEGFEVFGFFQGGIYVVLVDDLGSNKYDYKPLTVIPSNSVHMLWMVPQYFFAVVGEIMFAISGNEFAYSEAPITMKSCVQAIWYLIKSLGGLLIMTVEGTFEFRSLSLNVLTYIIICSITLAGYILMSIKYKYVQHEDEAQLRE